MVEIWVLGSLHTFYFGRIDDYGCADGIELSDDANPVVGLELPRRRAHYSKLDVHCIPRATTDHEAVEPKFIAPSEGSLDTKPMKADVLPARGASLSRSPGVRSAPPEKKNTAMRGRARPCLMKRP
jgi:hypothetical protein